MKRSTAGIVLAFVLLLLVLLTVRGPQPPAVVPADAPEESFSAERAEAHLQAIARKPHPVGTAEHARVREYIVEQIRGLGLEPRLQEAEDSRAFGGFAQFVRVTNVLTRLAGTETGAGRKAVLLMSHYDTVPTSPGAGDDSSGVAVMLETLRALRAGEPLENDVIFLFTDAEEVGLNGARAFVDQHPWAAEVGVLLNFEARGTGGPSLMFETSPGNAPLMALFDRVVSDPAATSYSYEVYRRMPNDTDYTPFKERSTPGYNFAFIHGGTGYHSALDTLANLDRRSVQHHGDSALALTRELGAADLSVDFTTRDAVYFNLIGDVWFDYSSALVLPLAVLLVIGAVLVVAVGWRRGRLSAAGMAGALVAALVASAAVGAVLYFAAGFLLSSYNFVLWNGWTSTSLVFLGLGLVAVALALVLRALFIKKIRSDNLVAGSLLLWLVFSVAVSLMTPGASYLFVWPLVMALAAVALDWRRDSDDDPVSVPLFVLLGLSVFVTVCLWAPTFGLLGTALGRLAGPVLGAFVTLLLLAPLGPSLAVLSASFRRRGWLVPAAFTAAGLLVLVAVRAGSGFNAENPRMNSVFYYLDAETSQASWFTLDDAVDGWTSRFLSQNPESRERPAMLGSTRPLLAGDAPGAELEGARVEWIGESTNGGKRSIDLRLSWSWNPQRAIVLLRRDAPIDSITWGSRTAKPTGNSGVGAESHRYRLAFFAPSPAGVELRLELDGEAPVVLEAVAQRYELPRLEGFPSEPRPADRMPSYGWYTDSTFVRTLARWTPGAAAAPEAVDESAEDTGP